MGAQLIAGIQVAQLQLKDDLSILPLPFFDRRDGRPLTLPLQLPKSREVDTLTAAGIVSSLQASNVRLRRALHNQQDYVHHPRYPLLFDPQTAGGLLASVPADRAADCIAALRGAGYAAATVIGDVRPQRDALAPITLAD